MSNIIEAILNLVNCPITELSEYTSSHNRVNNMGESLEEYVRDLFAGTVNEADHKIRNRKINETFAYLGNQNNPPDIILRNGDAIEVKKIESKKSGLALNSSHPKNKLFANSKMITDACRHCEHRDVKDIIYTVGVVKNNKLSNLSMVYGVDYAANEEIYRRVSDVISVGINLIPNVEFAKTNELARVNKVDPLGITYLRIRGMWGIDNPLKVFSYIYQIDDNKDFNFMALINEEKYITFSNREKLERLAEENVGLSILDTEIKNPDNPALLKKAKLITYSK